VVDSLCTDSKKPTREACSGSQDGGSTSSSSSSLLFCRPAKHRCTRHRPRSEERALATVAVEGRHGGAWRRWWLGGEAWWWQVCHALDLRFVFCAALALDLGIMFYVVLALDLGYAICASWSARCKGLYSAARAVDGDMALIADIDI
jgi:hypothetical protein